MKKIFLIFSIFSFLSLSLFAQKTEVSENFDAKTAFDGNWSSTGSWVLNTTSLETTNITGNVKNAYMDGSLNSTGDIVCTYNLPENTYDDKTPTRDISFYWLTDMSSNTNADLFVYVEASTDNSIWSTIVTKQLDLQTDYESVVDSSKSIGAADWATYSAETNATKKWRHAIINNVSISSTYKYFKVRFSYQSGTAGGGWYVDNVEVRNTRSTSTMDFFEDFNNISFTSGEWTETNADGNYGWVDSTVTYDKSGFSGNTNAAYIAGTNLAAQDETITFTHNLETKPTAGVKKWELSFFWRTDMEKNNGNAANITIGLRTSTDGTNFGSSSTIWKEDDQTIFNNTVDSVNSENPARGWNEYKNETSSNWKWYHAKVDLTSYIGSNIKAIKLVLNYKGQSGGDFMMDGLMLAKTAKPEFSVNFALNNYETVPLEQVDTNGYTINYSVVNNDTTTATSVATLDLHVQGPSGTYNGNAYKQFTISTVAGADASGIYTFKPADFIPSDSSGQNIVGTYSYWITGSVTTSNATTNFIKGNENNLGTFDIDLNKYTKYKSNTGGGIVTENTTSKGFGSIFYLRKTDHFKGIKMDRTAATETNKVKYYIYKVDDPTGANPIFIYEADTSSLETDTIATKDEHIKLSAGYYMVFVTAYSGDLAFYTDTTESANTAYFTGKPYNWTKVSGQGDIALAMLLRENQAFQFSSTAGGVQNKTTLVLNEGVKVDFKLKASDPDDDAGTFDFTGAPSWVSKTATTDTSVTVSMLPTRFDVGTYGFSVDGTDGKKAAKYNINLEVKDTKVLDVTTDNYIDTFATLGDWTNVNDYNLEVTSTLGEQHWIVNSGHMQVSCDKARDQKEVLYTPLYGVPVSNSSDKLLLFFSWQFDNLSNTGAADIADIQIDMYKKGGTLIKTIWQDDDTTTIGANTVKGQHFSSMQNFIAEHKIINAYEAATEYTTMLDLTANISDSIYFVITYTSPVTSASQIPVFWFDNFKVNFVPAVLDLKVDNNSGYPENKYTQIPLYQAADLMYNVGVQNLSNVTKTGNSLVAKVTNTANSDQLYEVYTYDVSPFVTTNITLTTKLQPLDTGIYTFYYGISDDAGGDLTDSSSLGITANEMAFDDGTQSVFTKQNDKSNSVGAKFILRKDDYLQKVKAYIDYPGGGKGYTFSVIKEGTPNTLVWTSDVDTTGVAAAFKEFTLNEPVKLAAGTYYLMVNDMTPETSTSLKVGVDDNSDNGGKFYRGDIDSIYEATDYTNTTYPDYKGDLMVRMILSNPFLDLKVDNNSGYPENKYTQIPFYQAADLMYKVDVQNLSNATKTGNRLVAKVTNNVNSDQLNEVYTYDVSPFITTSITLNTKLQPSDTGIYTFYYGINDVVGGDLTDSSSLGITVNEMAFDDGSQSVFTKQNDKSNSVGAKFILRKDDYLQKVKAYIDYPGGGKGYTFSVIKEGTPNTLVWTSDVDTTSVAAAFKEFTLVEPLNLVAGTYYLMVNDMATVASTSLKVGVDDNTDNGGKFYRGDIDSIYEATDYTNTTYPDYKGDLMVRMILSNPFLDLKVDNNSGYPENKYTQIPLYQAEDLMYKVDVQNLSNVTKTGNKLVAEVTNANSEQLLYEVYTYDVSPLATTNITLTKKLQPLGTGDFTFDYGISDVAGGDLSSSSILGITSNEMAFDDGTQSVFTKQNVKSNSIGAKFILRKDDYLQKVKAYIDYPGGGKGYTFSVIKTGTPNTLVWTSSVYTTAVTSAFEEFTLDEPVKLTAGTYYLMVNDMATETSTSLQVGVDDNADNMGKYYRGDLNSIYEATDYTNTTYPDYKGDLMVRMVLSNNAPDVATIADQKATENKSFSVQVGASDKEGDAITYNVTNKPTWLSFDASTSTFSGTPSGTDAGDHYVEFYATDGRDSTVNTFKITVAKDPLPYFTTVPSTDLVEGQTYSYTAHAADFDGQVVTISTEGTLPTGLTATGTPGADATYTVTGTLAVGQHFVQLRATDSNGGFVVQSYMINVTANNAPYFISEGIMHTYSGEAYNLSVVAKDDNASDVLAITAKTTLPAWLSLTDNGDGTAMLKGTAPDSVAGTSTIKLQVADNIGAVDSLVFDLKVEVRVKPVITAIPDTTVKTLQVFSTMVSATDANGDEVVISAVSKPNWISFAGLNDGSAKLNGTPTEAGTYKVSLLASDGYLMSDTVSFTITVIPNPNTTPVLGATPDTTIMTGTSFKYTVSATDADGDVLRFVGTNIPSWLNIQDNMNGTADIIGDPDEANIGVHTVTVGVTDGVNSVEQSFVVTVTAATTGAKKSAEVMVYPNPSKQYITIDNAEKASIKIFSLSGKLLKEITNANLRQNIDVSGINPGIYLIKINKENEIITQKINIVK